MRDALRAEWWKIRTLPGQLFPILFAAVLTIGGSIAAVAAGGPHPPDPVQLGLIGVRLGQAAVVIGGVRIIAGEYSQGLLSTTLLALPRRLTVLAAKAVYLTAGVAVTSLLAVVASMLSAGLSFGDGPALRAAAGSIAYLVLVGLLSLGAGAAFRSTAAGVCAVLSLLYLMPVAMRMFTDSHIQRLLYCLTPATALDAVLTSVDSSALPMGPTAALAVVAAWAAAGLSLGAWSLHRRGP